MQLAARVGVRELLEEVQELRFAVAVVAAIEDLAGRDLQRGEQCGGPVALVVMGGLLAQPGPDWQDRLRAVQRLDLRLLIHAQHDRVLRRIEVEADDVADLGLQLGIGGELERLAPPRLHAVGTPRARDRRVADPQVLAQQPRGPVGDRQRRRRRLQRRGDDLRIIDRLGPTTARLVTKAGEPVRGGLFGGGAAGGQASEPGRVSGAPVAGEVGAEFAVDRLGGTVQGSGVLAAGDAAGGR